MRNGAKSHASQVAKARNDKDDLDNSTSAPAEGRLDREAVVCPSAASGQNQAAAVYPEYDDRILAPAPESSLAVERTGPPAPDCETLPATKFARDPMQAARLARDEHKLMLVLHISGNFEESKFT
jgi:hypothetical protein